MTDFGFCGPSYQSQSVNANAQKCENFYLERDESGSGKSKFQLLCTPGTKSFVHLYEDTPGLSVVGIPVDMGPLQFTLTPGTYYAALAMLDGAGNAVQRSRVFGPFPVRVLITALSFVGRTPTAAPPGFTWYLYFGTNRAALNQRLALGSGSPVNFSDSFLRAGPLGPNYIADPATGYIFGAQGLQQPTPGVGTAWNVFVNGPVQGDQTATVTTPVFDTSHANFSVGLFLRAQGAPSSPTSFYELGLSASNPQVAIYRTVNGVSTVLASLPTVAIPANSVLSFSVVGGLLTAKLNGVIVLTVSDAALTTGTTGFITTGPPLSAFTSTTIPGATSLIVTTNGAQAVLPEVDLPNSVPAQTEKDGRTFATSQGAFWEVYSDNYARFISSIANDFLPKVLAASNIQIVLASAGKLYVYTLATGVFQEISTDATTALQGPVVSVGFTDSYVIALLRDGRFQISGILDAVHWDPADITKVSVFADTPIGMKVDHREIIIYSAKHYVVYYDSGNPLFPFDVVPGGFAEMGAAAPASVERADNTLFWIGSDERGTGMAWRAQGYSPTRISTHAIEEHWRKFSTVNDARTFAYQEAGHTHIVFYFPSADETWAYDVATQAWHQRSGLAVESHSFSFGKHLVGSAKTGTIYEMSIDLATYDGQLIHRERIGPYISSESRWLFMNSVEFDIETGLAPMPPLLDGGGKPRPAQIMVYFSDANGKEWSQERRLSLGFAGEFAKRVIARRLGRFWGTKGRLIKLTYAEPVPIRITNAYADVD